MYVTHVFFFFSLFSVCVCVCVYLCLCVYLRLCVYATVFVKSCEFAYIIMMCVTASVLCMYAVSVGYHQESMGAGADEFSHS